MKATLTSEVELWDIAVFAELAIWEDRPELKRLCASIAATGGLSHSAFERQLPGVSVHGFRNLERHIRYLGLTDEQGRLTAFGRRCADTGEAPAWEQGTYHLLVARHPIFESLILDFQRAHDPLDRDYSDLTELPSWLKPSVEQVYISAIDPRAAFSVAKFPSSRGTHARGRVEQLEAARVMWEIDLTTGQNTWRVKGTVENPHRSLLSSPRSVVQSKLSNVYSQWEPRWDGSVGRLAMEFDGGVKAGGREEFLRSFRYPPVQLPLFGSFSDVVVDGVPVGPASNADAREWATAIAVGRIEAAEGYSTPTEWLREWDEATTATPLHGRAGTAPDPLSIEAVARRPLAQRTRWLLAAAADLRREA